MTHPPSSRRLPLQIMRIFGLLITYVGSKAACPLSLELSLMYNDSYSNIVGIILALKLFVFNDNKHKLLAHMSVRRGVT
jgi:hypothetical protein